MSLAPMTRVRLSQADLHEAARLLARCCSTGTVAAVLNDLLCVDAEPDLTDDEAEAGQALFESLAEAAPEAVDFARDGDPTEVLADPTADLDARVDADVAEISGELSPRAIELYEQMLRCDYATNDPDDRAELDRVVARISELMGEDPQVLHHHFESEARLNLGLEPLPPYTPPTRVLG